MTATTDPSEVLTFDRGELEQRLPYGPGFLFLDTCRIDGETIDGTYRIRDDLPLLQDHFKHEPVFPASIMTEAMGQLGVMFLLAASHPALNPRPHPSKIFFASADGIRCSRICRPGDQLTLTLTCRKVRAPLAIFRGAISCGEEKVAAAESITLIFDATGIGS